MLEEIHSSSKDALDAFAAEGLNYDLTRGKPGRAQLDLTTGMLDVISDADDCFSEGGFDCRNYGILDGLPETKRLSPIFSVSPQRGYSSEEIPH